MSEQGRYLRICAKCQKNDYMLPNQVECDECLGYKEQIAHLRSEVERLEGESRQVGKARLAEWDQCSKDVSKLQKEVQAINTLYVDAEKENITLTAENGELREANEVLTDCLNGSSKAEYSAGVFDLMRKKFAGEVGELRDELLVISKGFFSNGSNMSRYALMNVAEEALKQSDKE